VAVSRFLGETPASPGKYPREHEHRVGLSFGVETVISNLVANPRTSCHAELRMFAR
jgi:hypothetical protein